MKKADDKSSLGKNKSARKKRYHSPQLSSFGAVTQVTQSNMISALSDGGMNMMAPS